jgi:hypothetical protein
MLKFSSLRSSQPLYARIYILIHMYQFIRILSKIFKINKIKLDLGHYTQSSI